MTSICKILNSNAACLEFGPTPQLQFTSELQSVSAVLVQFWSNILFVGFMDLVCANVENMCEIVQTKFRDIRNSSFGVWQYGVIDFVLFILCDLLWTPHSGMWS